jgi:hypothetical protein
MVQARDDVQGSAGHHAGRSGADDGARDGGRHACGEGHHRAHGEAVQRPAIGVAGFTGRAFGEDGGAHRGRIADAVENSLI